MTVYSEADVDRLAREMAMRAGKVWDQLNAYPGFERNRWRGEAERMLKRLRDEAARVH